MSSFKHKPEKLKYLTNINTLDEVHRKQVETFETKNKNLSKKKNLFDKLQKDLEYLNTKNKEDVTPDDIKKRATIREKLKELTDEINETENGFAEIDYYSRTHELLVEYYKQLEDEDDDNIPKQHNNITDTDNENIQNDNIQNDNIQDDTITDTITETTTSVTNIDKLEALNELSRQKRKVKKETKRRLRKQDDGTKKKNILNFFTEKKTLVDSFHQESDSNNNTPEENNIEQVVSNRATLFESYMNLISKSQMSITRSKIIRTCDNCGTEKTLIQSEGMYVCRKCGEVENIVIESEVPNHKDTINEKPRYPYKRLIWSFKIIISR
jgi:NADH pyrophosphatase NudC (nudix superfamily)